MYHLGDSKAGQGSIKSSSFSPFSSSSTRPLLSDSDINEIKRTYNLYSYYVTSLCSYIIDDIPIDRISAAKPVQASCGGIIYHFECGTCGPSLISPCVHRPMRRTGTGHGLRTAHELLPNKNDSLPGSPYGPNFL